MDDISTMLNDKRKYQNLKYNINLIIEKLDSVIESLDTPSDKIDQLYNIDSISIDGSKLYSVRQNLINKKNYLKNIVLVEINNELNNLTNGIEGMG